MKAGKIKVAIVAPPFGEIGGPEVVAKNLAEALQEEGIDVTLFAPGDWKTRVKHVPTLKKSIWNMASSEKGNVEKLRIDNQMEVVGHADKFDIIHFHCQRYSPLAAEKINKPCVLTFHNNFSKEAVLMAKKAKLHLVAISHAQNKENLADVVIYNGIPIKDIKSSYDEGKYLLFLGRLTDQKGVDKAIQIAKKAEKKLYILGRIGNTKERKEYFEEKIKPFIDGKQIYYPGTVDHDKVYEYCAGAQALLFPIRRPEAFGLVAIEALACGTPVIGTRVAPLPEILKDDQVAFLSDDVDELVEAAKNSSLFDRKACREYAKKNFDSSVMARKYIEFYKKLLAR